MERVTVKMMIQLLPRAKQDVVDQKEEVTTTDSKATMEERQGAKASDSKATMDEKEGAKAGDSKAAMDTEGGMKSGDSKAAMDGKEGAKTVESSATMDEKEEGKADNSEAIMDAKEGAKSSESKAAMDAKTSESKATVSVEDVDLINCYVLNHGISSGNKVSRRKEIGWKEWATGEWKHTEDVDRFSCLDLKKKIDVTDSMDCNEMIAYWMMEGSLGHIDSVEEAYRKGHEIFMKLKFDQMPGVERHENKRINNNDSETTYERHRGSYSKIRLGFVDVFDFVKECEPLKLKLGDLVPENGVIRTLLKNKDTTSTCLLLDGNKLDRQVIGYFNKHLKHFAYFSPRTNLLNSKLPGLENLSVLVLRGCRFLEEINEYIGEMKELTLLEISGPNSYIKTIPDIFKKVTKLRTLNLAYLSIQSLPKNSFPKLVDLRRLILRGCSSLTHLPSTRDMTKLEVLDLYGATSLEKLSTTNFRNHQIKMLDLSHSKVTRVPCLFDQTNDKASITHLFLRNCLRIYVFDIMEHLVSLRVLDVSGTKNLKQINFEPLKGLVVLDLSGTDLDFLDDDCFSTLTKLSQLNLSNTHISSLPKILHLSELQVLNISCCKNLKELGKIAFVQLPSLLSLDLSGTSIENFKILDSSRESSSNQHLECRLQVLDLSNTSIKELPSMSHLKSLKQLLLSGCRELTLVPDLENLSELEVLDLSRTNIEGSFPLTSSFTKLEELDLRGTCVTEFPFDLVNDTCLKCLQLPHKIHITQADWSSRKNLPEEIFWDQPLEIFDSVNVLISNDKEHFMSAKPSKDSRLFRLVDTESSWEGYFKQFHFSVSHEENQEAKIHFGGVELVFKGHHPLAKKILSTYPKGQSVEIHGFSIFPEDTKSALEKAVNVALVTNDFIYSLSDECFQHTKAMKVCWINSCTGMKYVLGRKPPKAIASESSPTKLPDQDDSASGSSQVLSTQNVVALESKPTKLTDQDAGASGSNQVLSTQRAVASESNPTKLSDQDVNASGSSQVLSTQNAVASKSIQALPDENDGVSGNSPAVSNQNAGAAESIQALPDQIAGVSGNSSVVSDQNAGVMKSQLETLVLSNLAGLKDFSAEKTESQTMESLKHIYVDCCAVLSKIISTFHLPENLETLHIKFCDQLKLVCGEDSKCKLPKLRELSLLGLPELNKIGAELPSLERLIISRCPKLNVSELDNILQCPQSELTCLRLDSCPQLNHVFPSSVLPQKIQKLEIRTCGSLSTVFDSADSPSPSLTSLQHLQLWNLPKLKSIGVDFPSLETSDINYCSRLPRKLWPQKKTSNQPR